MQPDVAVNPARIDRARDALPDGYEVSSYTGPPAPFVLWGFRDLPVSDPAQCAVLAAPSVDAATAKGWSASGPGGIVYAVVADGASGPPGPALLAECGQWTAVSGRTTGTVTGLPGPAIDAAETVGMSTSAVTLVEGGTETRSQTATFVAHLGRYLCFVAIVTDPGSPLPALGPGFASDLLAETVTTLRG
ncbi:hypothetical protein C6A85_84965 [Mycobacterium sp. ITM-2017-0098]|nr:hypothetical protein C6A85_84965 [Mycobacterium sp. ITM-2017-0098]